MGLSTTTNMRVLEMVSLEEIARLAGSSARPGWQVITGRLSDKDTVSNQIKLQVVGKDVAIFATNQIVSRILTAWSSIHETNGGCIPKIGDLRAAIPIKDDEYGVLIKLLDDGDMMTMRQSKLIARFSGQRLDSRRFVSDLPDETAAHFRQIWDVRKFGNQPVYSISTQFAGISNFVTTWQFLALPVLLSDDGIGVFGVTLPYEYSMTAVTQFLDAVVEGFAVWSRQGIEEPTCQFTNDAFNGMVKLAPKEPMVGKRYSDLIKDEGGAIAEAIEIAQLTGQPQIVPEGRLLDPFDPSRLFRISVAVVDEHLITSFADITDELRGENRLAFERETASSLIQALEITGHDIIVNSIEEDDFRIVYTNDSFLRRTGRSQDEIEGRPLREVNALLRGDLPEFADTMDYVREERMNWIRCRCFTARDETVAYELMHLKLPDSQRILTVLKDVTEEERLRSIREQTKRAEAIGRLGGAVAHEINNHLQPILGMIRSTLEKLPESMTEERRQLWMALESARNTKAVVAEMMMQIHPRTDNRRMSKDFLKEVSTAVDLASSNLPTGIELVRKGMLLGAVKSIASVMSVEETNQIVLNLIKNAADACVIGNEKIEVSLIDTVDRQFVLTISDNGHGMDESTVTRIFDPYFSTKVMGGKGRGIGLSVVYRIIHDRGGSIHVNSRKGQGTAFTLLIPMKDA